MKEHFHNCPACPSGKSVSQALAYPAADGRNPPQRRFRALAGYAARPAQQREVRLPDKRFAGRGASALAVTREQVPRAPTRRPNGEKRQGRLRKRPETGLLAGPHPHHSRPEPRVARGFQAGKRARGLFRARLDGGDEEDRTPDLRIANAALSQLSYVPIELRIIASRPICVNWRRNPRLSLCSRLAIGPVAPNCGRSRPFAG